MERDDQFAIAGKVAMPLKPARMTQFFMQDQQRPALPASDYNQTGSIDRHGFLCPILYLFRHRVSSVCRS